MHEVVPKVVAIAVSIVMAKWMIFCQSSFLLMVSMVVWWMLFFEGTDYTDYTDFHCFVFP